MTQQLLEQFTGTDGASWATPTWTIYTWGGASTCKIQTNRGRMTAIGLGGAYDAGAEADLLGSYGPKLEISGTATYVSSTGFAESYFQIFARYGSSSGYFCEIGGGALNIYRRDSGATSNIGTFAISTPLSTVWGFKFRLNGSAISWKAWDTSGAEPISPQISVTDATYASAGLVILSASNGADGKTEVWDVDNFNIDNLEPPPENSAGRHHPRPMARTFQ